MNDFIMPADIYVVINKSIITDYDKLVLQMLYLPIIGPLSLNLYNILINDLDKQNLISSPFNHSHLLSNLQISSAELISTRNILEGIGLLKTYYKKDTVGNYIYELYSPMSAHEFFNHPILNIVLYNNIGNVEYQNLQKYYKVQY